MRLASEWAEGGRGEARERKGLEPPAPSVPFIVVQQIVEGKGWRSTALAAGGKGGGKREKGGGLKTSFPPRPLLLLPFSHRSTRSDRPLPRSLEEREMGSSQDSSPVRNRIFPSLPLFFFGPPFLPSAVNQKTNRAIFPASPTPPSFLFSQLFSWTLGDDDDNDA